MVKRRKNRARCGVGLFDYNHSDISGRIRQGFLEFSRATGAGKIIGAHKVVYLEDNSGVKSQLYSAKPARFNLMQAVLNRKEHCEREAK